MYRCFAVLCTLGNTAAIFQIVKHDYNSGVHRPNSTLEMKCRTNEDWEYCIWRHTGYTGDGSTTVRQCNLEWKRTKNAVIKQDCHDAVSNRVSITGIYKNYECGIKIDNLNEQDSGTWECEMEQYFFGGGQGSGSRDSHAFIVQIQLPTTEITSEPSTEPEIIETTLPTTSITTTTTITSTSTITTTETTSTTSLSSAEAPTASTSIDEAAESEVLGRLDLAEEDLGVDSLSAGAVDSNLTTLADVSSVYRESLEEETDIAVGSNAGLIICSLGAVVILAVAAAVGVAVVRRRMTFDRIVTMHKLREEMVVKDGFITDDVAIVQFNNTMQQHYN